MSAGRAEILGAVRRAVKRDTSDEAARDTVDARLDTHRRGQVPARGQRDHDAQVALFAEMAQEVAASVERVADPEAVPEAVAAYLKAQNLPAALRMAPDPALEALPWDRQPLLQIETGPAQAADQVSLTGAFSGIAETGTLMLTSGPAGPTTLNFLPDNHIVVLHEADVVGAYEDAWDRLRARFGAGAMPRTVNCITGPSRTADIEQTIQLGAHGPRRLHIILVGDLDGGDGRGR